MSTCLLSTKSLARALALSAAMGSRTLDEVNALGQRIHWANIARFNSANGENEREGFVTVTKEAVGAAEDFAPCALNSRGRLLAERCAIVAAWETLEAFAYNSEGEEDAIRAIKAPLVSRLRKIIRALGAKPLPAKPAAAPARPAAIAPVVQLALF